jgi:hypothetical protein
MSFSDSYVELDGCGTHLRRGGAGEPLVMSFMGKLVRRFDVLVPEHPLFARDVMPALKAL